MSDLTKLVDGIRAVMKDHVWDNTTIWDLCSHTDERIAEAVAMHRAVRRINTFLDDIANTHDTAPGPTIDPSVMKSARTWTT